MLRVCLARSTSLLVYIKTVKHIPGINWALTALIYFWLSFKSQVTLLINKICVCIYQLLINMYLLGQSQATAVLATCASVSSWLASLLAPLEALAPVRV